MDGQINLFTNEEEIEIAEGYTCINCDVFQPADQFQHMQSGEVKRKCRTCARNQSKLIKELRTVHPYPSDDYTCPICDRGLEEISKHGQRRLQNWVLDHCHDTEEFRGWLCHHCNVGLGAFNDSIKRIKRAFYYMENHHNKGGIRDGRETTEGMVETTESFGQEKI